MLILLIMITMLSISLIFTQLSHPLSIGFILLTQTFLSCLITGLSSKSFWYSYILFLVFLGGMLVLFIYMTSLASNEMFSFSMKLLLFTFLFMSIFSLLILIFDTSLIVWIENNDILQMLNKNYFLNENKMTLMKIYNYPSNLLTLLIINYLFFTLVVIVKITNFYSGPLRMKM